MKTIAIIWAGAAGLMTAVTILENSPPFRGSERGYPTQPPLQGEEYHIHLFEKNTTPGKKVIISGWGRCNVTTGITDKKILATKYTRGWEFIERAMGKFSPKKCREWFETHGVPLKCEEDNRVFPISDDGHDVVGAFEEVFAKYRDRISLHYGEGVSEVSFLSSWGTKDLLENQADSSQTRNDKKHDDEKFSITTPKWSYEADILVITTGWNAYSHTGSTGDGYAFARSLGHTVTQLGPSLSSFLTRENWLHALSGLSFPSAKVSLSFSVGESLSGIPNDRKRSSAIAKDDKREDLTWPLLLTHFGISWPLAFMTSSALAWDHISPAHAKIIHLSPLSDMETLKWETFLKEQFVLHPKKLITSILAEKLPRRFAEAFILEYFSHIRETFASSISKKDRERIAELLGSGIPLTLLERRPGDEFVTAWGVSTDELDPETMESKIHNNLYFAGEVLNVDGYTGGFSLQICWASGYSSGKEIVRKLAQEEKSI